MMLFFVRYAWRIHFSSIQAPTKPAAILMVMPMIAALNKKLSMDCAITAFRIMRDMTATSKVCAATAIVKEK